MSHIHAIYTATYVCKVKSPAGVPGYNDVVLGLDKRISSSDIHINGTCANFEIGKEYLITIGEIQQ